jgi:DNA-binding XRE family transcriptional regulator
MNDQYSKWSDARAKGRAADPRTPAEQAVGREAAKERHEAYIRGHQLAEMRQAAEITQAELADSLGVSQARVSKIEHGENSGINVVRAYIDALGGHLDVIASIGDQTWRLA